MQLRLAHGALEPEQKAIVEESGMIEAVGIAQLFMDLVRAPEVGAGRRVDDGLFTGRLAPEKPKKAPLR